MTQKSLDKKVKPNKGVGWSDAFEGPNSSLARAFNEAVERGREKTRSTGKPNNEWDREIKLALINSGLINQDGWICTGTESSDFNEEFEQVIIGLKEVIRTLLLQQLDRVRREVEDLESTFDYFEGEQEDYPYPGEVISEVKKEICQKLQELEKEIGGK